MTTDEATFTEQDMYDDISILRADTATYTEHEFKTGCYTVAYAIKFIATCVASAWAFSFSGFWMVLLMWVIALLVAELAALLAGMAVGALLGEEQLAHVGRFSINTFEATKRLFNR